MLNNNEAKELNIVNPDEDLILMVADFVRSRLDVQVELFRFKQELFLISNTLVEHTKNNLVNYWKNQSL